MCQWQENCLKSRPSCAEAIRKHFRAAIFLAGVLAFGAAPRLCQMNTGEIDGIVRDPTGAVVVNATITAVEAGTQLKYTTKTNASGEYLLAQLPVGQYTLTVSMDGFKQIAQCPTSSCTPANISARPSPWNSENKAKP